MLLASLKPLVDSKTITVVTNAGASQSPANLCSPYVFSTSWTERPDARGDGHVHESEGREVGLSDRAELCRRQGSCWRECETTFKGKVVGQELTRWPDQLDFSAELSKARAASPTPIFVFYPGAAGIQFVTQYVQSGLKGQIPLYTVSPSTNSRCRG